MVILGFNTYRWLIVRRATKDNEGVKPTEISVDGGTALIYKIYVWVGMCVLYYLLTPLMEQVNTLILDFLSKKIK